MYAGQVFSIHDGRTFVCATENETHWFFSNFICMFKKPYSLKCGRFATIMQPLYYVSTGYGIVWLKKFSYMYDKLNHYTYICHYWLVRLCSRSFACIWTSWQPPDTRASTNCNCQAWGGILTNSIHDHTRNFFYSPRKGIRTIHNCIVPNQKLRKRNPQSLAKHSIANIQKYIFYLDEVYIKYIISILKHIMG